MDFNNAQGGDCKVVDKVCQDLGEVYKSSTDTITIARCNVRNVRASRVYCLPTIKLYPANAKCLPVEYIPNDYSHVEGYIKFIEQERYHQSQSQIPRTIESVG